MREASEQRNDVVDNNSDRPEHLASMDKLEKTKQRKSNWFQENNPKNKITREGSKAAH